MKAGWEVKTLEQLSKKKDAVVSGPFGSNLKVSDYKTTGIPILRLQNIGKGYFIDKDIKYITNEKAEELKYHSFVAGDIALAKLGIPIGKTCIIPDYFKAGIITADIVRIRPDTDIVDYKFLEYFLNTDLSVSQLTGNISGATRPRVNLSDVRNIELPLPPLPEQQRIVALLDKAFASIATAKANTEQNLKNARALFDSYLHEVFSQRGEGWEEKKLEELGTITSSKRIFKNEYVDSGIPFYRTKEIKELANNKEITTELFISNERYSEIKNNYGIPKDGDILFTAVGTIGEIYVVKGNNDFYFKDGNVLWFKNFKSINSYFLRYVLISFVENLNDIAHGSAYNALPIQRLNNHKIYVPSLKEQLLIVSKLDDLKQETQRLETLYQRKLTALDELKKSLLHKAFNGEL